MEPVLKIKWELVFNWIYPSLPKSSGVILWPPIHPCRSAREVFPSLILHPIVLNSGSVDSLWDNLQRRAALLSRRAILPDLFDTTPIGWRLDVDWIQQYLVNTWSCSWSLLEGILVNLSAHCFFPKPSTIINLRPDSNGPFLSIG